MNQYFIHPISVFQKPKAKPEERKHLSPLAKMTLVINNDLIRHSHSNRDLGYGEYDFDMPVQSEQLALDMAEAIIVSYQQMGWSAELFHDTLYKRACIRISIGK